MGTSVVMNRMNLLEVANRTHNNNIIAIAEIQDEFNGLVSNAPMLQANNIHSHKLNQRGSLPTISLRGPNQGSASTVSHVIPKTEEMSIFDDLIQVDQLLFNGISDKNSLKETEIYAHLEALDQAQHELLTYGSEADDAKELNGLLTRFYVSTQDNVTIKSGSGGDTTSMLMIEWGPRRTHLIYPEGSTAGIYEEDLGFQVLGDDTNGYRRAWMHQIMVEFGIAVHDDRSVQRLGNIESTGTTNNLVSTSGTNDILTMKNKLPTMNQSGMTRLYVNRDLKTQLDIVAQAKSNVFLTIETFQNYQQVTRFFGMPVEMLEQIVSTESALS